MAEKKGQDLFDLLMVEHAKEIEEKKFKMAGDDDPVGTFVTFAREYLKKNPAIATYIAEHGLGLRLQDNTAVPLVYVKPRPMARDAVAITRPDGPGGILDAGAQPITGG